MATRTTDLTDAELEPTPEYEVADAPRLAQELVIDLQNDVQHPALELLSIRNAELGAALDLDQRIADAVLRDTYPHLRRLLEQKIRVRNAQMKDPFLVEQRRDKLDRLRQQRQERSDAAARRAMVRRATPLALVGGALLAGGVTAFNVARPEILRILAQNQINIVATDNLSNRELATTTPSRVDLKGVPIRFACIKTADGTWEAGDIRDVFTDETLESSSYPYQVKFGGGVDPDLSVAEAGWGTTVLFPPAKVSANFPAAYGATAVLANGSAVYSIPTGQFITDPEHVLPAEFTTGEHAQDGSLVHYVLVSPDGPACAGAATDADPELKMVDATLDTEYPELSLENLAGEMPEVDGAYTEQFAKYGLDTWYSRTFYPNLVLSFDTAVREASKSGVSRDKLQIMADFLTNHTFEKSLLRLLQYLQANVKKDTFQQFVDQLKKSNAPHFAINVDEAYETTGSHAHEPDRVDEARQGWVTAYPSDLNEGVLFDGLIREISHAAPTPGMAAYFTGNPLENRPQDYVFDQGIGYFLTEKGIGTAAGTPSQQLIERLVDKGQVDEVIRFWTYNPDDKLSENGTALFNDTTLSLPASLRQQDIYDAILEASTLDKPLAEVTPDEKAQLTIFVQAHDKSVSGDETIEGAAQTMLGALETLSQ